MNAHDILDMIGDAKGTYVWDAQQVRSGNVHSSGKKLFAKKLWLIAAIIALILLLVGCAIVYVMSHSFLLNSFLPEELMFPDRTCWASHT